MKSEIRIFKIISKKKLDVLQPAVADPGFPRGGGANPLGRGGRQHAILPNFPKYCMKLKEFAPRGARPSRPP